MSLLSDEEKLAFKRNGFLPVADAVDEDLVGDAVELVWNSIDENPADPSTLVGRGYHLDVWDDLPEEETGVFDAINDEVFAYAEELVGGNLLEDPDERVQLPLQFPDEEQVLSGSKLPDHGHVDGYGPGFRESGEVGGFSIGVATYYTRVQARGGGFTVWPGSHWIVAQYYTNHVLETPGHAHSDSIPAPIGDAHEVTGDPGTIVLWHNKLVHTGGINLTPHVRIASISRFRRADFDEIQRDASDKLWKYWPGMEDITPGNTRPRVLSFIREEYSGGNEDGETDGSTPTDADDEPDV